MAPQSFQKYVQGGQKFFFFKSALKWFRQHFNILCYEYKDDTMF